MEHSIPHQSRRSFLQAATAGTGLGVLAHAGAGLGAAPKPAAPDTPPRLPREVWVASVTQDGLSAGNYHDMIKAMLARMEQVVPFRPDIICLPEVFPFVNLPDGRPPLDEVAEEPIGAVCEPFAEFARQHRCHVVCPVYTRQDGRYYNAAVFIGREGQLVGEYRKMHPTVDEMQRGIEPGPLDPPVFETDFGKVGAQVCFDIEWTDGWEKLRRKGAEIVFWPSAFAGGAMVGAKAVQNHYCVVSTRKGTTRICDITGEELATTGHFAHFVCAPVNLEKVFLHTWPFCQRFPEIHARYGRKVRIRTFHEEEWSILESRSPDVRVADVMKEFDLQTRDEMIDESDQAQHARRPA
ncbi:MAG: carbon-nitrogen hydrolase family protein [Thermoguttaceae bacterium]